MLLGLNERNLRWNYLSHPTKNADVHIASIYKALAIKIRIFGLQQVSKESERKDRPPNETAIAEAMEHFRSLRPDINPKELQDKQRQGKIISNFLITVV